MSQEKAQLKATVEIKVAENENSPNPIRRMTLSICPPCLKIFVHP